MISVTEIELHRLLRSEIFNMALHNTGRGRIAYAAKKREKETLKGTADIPEKKLLARSPTTKELILSDHDHRMLSIGIVEIEP